jgi:hypothetical protein
LNRNCLVVALLVAVVLATAGCGSSSSSPKQPPGRVTGAVHGFAVSAAQYPPGSAIQQQDPTNAQAQLLLGAVHSHSYRTLGRLNNVGSLQCGSQVVPVRTHFGIDRVTRTFQQGLAWCYVISVFNSPTAAIRAVADSKLQAKSAHIAGNAWNIVQPATVGRVANEGVTYRYASYASNKTVAEQVCVTAPTAGAFVTQLDKYCGLQRSALARGLPQVSQLPVQVPPSPIPVTPVPTVPPPPPATATPIPILYTTRSNAGVTANSQAPTSDACGNRRFLVDSSPPWEWMSLLSPTDQYEVDTVGVSGTAVMFTPSALSGADLWFTHPFGFDHEFAIVPDTQYRSLLSPSNWGNSSEGTDAEYSTAFEAGKPYGASIPGVLGVEAEKGLVPENVEAGAAAGPPYRVLQTGERVAVFGRWIADCGHKDFHAEIHPPLMMVGAQQTRLSGPIRIGSASSTETRVIGRPYMTGQQWSDGDMRQHLINELLKLSGIGGCAWYFFGAPCSTQLEAKTNLLPKPFEGLQLLDYIVRAPAPTTAQVEKLFVSYHFTVRHGVTVAVTPNDAESVRVSVLMNAAQYQPPKPPASHDYSVSSTQLLHDTVQPWSAWLLAPLAAAGGAVMCALIGVLSLNPEHLAGCLYAVVMFLARGVKTNIYDSPAIGSPLDGQNVVKDLEADQLRGSAQQSVDDNQPFPIYGYVNLHWAPPDLTIKPPR